MRAALAALIVLAGPVLAGAVLAETLERTPRPQPNPGYLAMTPAEVPLAAPPVSGMASSLRPKMRPQALATRVAAARGTGKDEGLDLMGLRPETRPEQLAAAEPAPKGRAKRQKDRETASKKGSVCGVAAIKGERIAPITSKVKGCGLAEGVRVTSVSGVRLSQAATIDCATATALNTWVAKVVQPAYGGRVVELKVAAHYICRPRNNRKGAKVSEHGRGKAIDIAGFTLDNGRVVTVAGQYDKTMRRAYRGACGVFGTTLGPGSDGYHEDHMHLDTAAHRSGPYCR